MDQIWQQQEHAVQHSMLSTCCSNGLDLGSGMWIALRLSRSLNQTELQLAKCKPATHLFFVRDHHVYISCAAVLRRLLREQEQGTLPEPPLPDTSTPQDTAAEMLAVATSHPTWMVKRWLQSWGQQETMSLLAHNNRSALLHCVTDVFSTTPSLVGMSDPELICATLILTALDFSWHWAASGYVWRLCHDRQKA